MIIVRMVETEKGGSDLHMLNKEPNKRPWSISIEGQQIPEMELPPSSTRRSGVVLFYQ